MQICGCVDFKNVKKRILLRMKIRILSTHVNLSLFFLIVTGILVLCCFMRFLLALGRINVILILILQHTEFLPIHVPIFYTVR